MAPMMMASCMAVFLRVAFLRDVVVLGCMTMRHHKPGSKQLGGNDHEDGSSAAAGKHQTHACTVADTAVSGNVTVRKRGDRLARRPRDT
jgi:hypothetical protein